MRLCRRDRAEKELVLVVLARPAHFCFASLGTLVLGGNEDVVVPE